MRKIIFKNRPRNNRRRNQQNFVNMVKDSREKWDMRVADRRNSLLEELEVFV